MTTSTLACPQCQTPLNANDRFCNGCGLDMAVITLMLEHSAVTTKTPGTAPFVPDILVPRLGEFLIKRQFLTEPQLQQALQHQREMANQQQTVMLGEALTSLGLISRENLDRAIMAQVLELQAALQSSNRQLEDRVTQRTKELERALTKLNEINQLKADFVSNISHELRTPLAQIKGYVVLMADQILGDLNVEQLDAMKTTVGAVERLERLIEDLIRFASAARGELIVNAGSFCLSDVAETAIKRSLPKASRATVHLDLKMPAAPVHCQGDSEKINWVLTQLIDNAIKFTTAGGTVTLGVSPDHDRHKVLVVVNDTGIGIPEGRLPELFQPFHQLDGSSTRRYGGTGLGLALVRRIVEAHGSEVKVKSVVNKGSAFAFDLPLVPPA